MTIQALYHAMTIQALYDKISTQALYDTTIPQARYDANDSHHAENPTKGYRTTMQWLRPRSKDHQGLCHAVIDTTQ